jgi:hypothetical protein
MRVSVVGEIVAAGLRRARRMSLYEVRVEDGSGRLKALWFNQPYLRDTVSSGWCCSARSGRCVRVAGMMGLAGPGSSAPRTRASTSASFPSEAGSPHRQALRPSWQVVASCRPRRSVARDGLNDGCPSRGLPAGPPSGGGRAGRCSAARAIRVCASSWRVLPLPARPRGAASGPQGIAGILRSGDRAGGGKGPALPLDRPEAGARIAEDMNFIHEPAGAGDVGRARRWWGSSPCSSRWRTAAGLRSPHRDPIRAALPDLSPAAGKADHRVALPRRQEGERPAAVAAGEAGVVLAPPSSGGRVRAWVWPWWTAAPLGPPARACARATPPTCA